MQLDHEEPVTVWDFVIRASVALANSSFDIASNELVRLQNENQLQHPEQDVSGYEDASFANRKNIS
jgi:hypothetical protein